MSAVVLEDVPALQSGWRLVRLGDICSKPQYGWTTKATTQGGAIKLLRTTDITSGQIDWSFVPYCTEPPPDLSKYLVHEGDILISRAGSVGVSHLVTTTEPSVFASYLIRFKPGPKVLPKYLAHFLKSPSYWRQIADNTAGIAVPNVNASKLHEVVLPLAPLAVQAKIVAEIEKQFSRLDEAVANLKRVKGNLKRYKAAVLKAAVEGRLSESGEITAVHAASGESQEKPTPFRLPADWSWVALGEVGEVTGGLTKNPRRESLSRKLPYLRVANVYADELRLDEMEQIGVADSELDKLLLRKDDLLVVEGNGSPDQIGRVALWNGSIRDCVHQNHLIKVRMTNVASRWVLNWLLSPQGRTEIERVASSTSGLYTLSTGKVARLPVPLPPAAEQHRIVAEVDRLLSLSHEAEQQIEANLARCSRLRTTTLASAFSGC